ncbi:uncharacterized protein F5Z01DRAFT_671610 [Emericellopsis atlantica]|uniref:Histone chaperone domain-containing protein n=1 Tax=Emericellopsis atlantica TaxID=2614577 RepID=A0A9P7ZSR9_9HYPO|nr:uncharacterized protein F5Z01DRAFT_671610 [Emericellopsis atlantica]KAG9257167.1 hypothetical protein F5Z01DRAFT_671610 [Emericellopsis atlantica]
MSAENLQNTPAGDFQDNSYVSRPGNKSEPLPVQSDGDKIEDPVDENVADTDAQLERDDNEAIDRGNILNERTRGATKQTGTYREPGDDEGLPGSDDGTSSTRQISNP